MRFQKSAAHSKKLLLRLCMLLSVLCAVLLLTQPAYAQTTYMITDGSRVLVHTTTATDPRAVLGEAGLELDEHDTYTTQAGDGTAEIQVRRGHRVYINNYGQWTQAVSTSETVGQLLARLRLSPGTGDTVSPAADRPTYEGLEIRVARVVYLEQTYTSGIPYRTTYCADPTLPEGTEKVLIAGVEGELTCTATVTYINGLETDRLVLREDVTRQPRDAIIALGCAVEAEEEPSALPVITDSTITLPTGEVLTYDGVITSLATAYCDKGLTATGTQARVGAIAVDPRRIPYGTRMFIMSKDGAYIYGIATAEDCGSLEHIVGTRIDLHFDTREECRLFGARECLVYFLS